MDFFLQMVYNLNQDMKTCRSGGAAFQPPQGFFTPPFSPLAQIFKPAVFAAVWLAIACTMAASCENPAVPGSLPGFSGTVRIEGDAAVGRFLYATGLEEEKGVYYQWRRIKPDRSSEPVGKNSGSYGLEEGDIDCLIKVEAVIPGYSNAPASLFRVPVVAGESCRTFTVSRGDFLGGAAISMVIYRDDGDCRTVELLCPGEYRDVEWLYNGRDLAEKPEQTGLISMEVLENRRLTVKAEFDVFPKPQDYSVTLKVTDDGRPYSLPVEIKVLPSKG